MSPAARLIAIATPVVAMAAVGVGLELGARRGVRAAVVYGAPAPRAGTGLAWQIVASEEDHGVRDPLAGAELDVTARAGERTATWRGATDADGVAEAPLALPEPAGAEGVEIEVRAGAALLARGRSAPEPPPPAARPATAWARFARREGPIELDVAVLGERVAPGFPARVWVRAQDAATHAAIAGVEVDPERDPSVATITAHASTDSRGWAELVATPEGLAISLALEARAPDGRKGTWSGGLYASPGAAGLATRARWPPDEPVEVEVFAPMTRSTAYVEIDDARGRAWAASLALAPWSGAAPSGIARGPSLKPGLYWAVAAGDPTGASELGPGTSVRPFFVATSDAEAMSFGEDAEGCAPARDVREQGRALATCLALAVARPVPRWLAVDGFAAARAGDAERRGRGLAVALTAIGVAVLLEAALLLQAAAGARLEMGAALPTERRRWSIAIAILAALLGFALLAAFLARLA